MCNYTTDFDTLNRIGGWLLTRIDSQRTEADVPRNLKVYNIGSGINRFSKNVLFVIYFIRLGLIIQLEHGLHRRFHSDSDNTSFSRISGQNRHDNVWIRIFSDY